MTINKEIIRRTSFFLQAIVEGKTIQMNEGAVWKDIDIDGEGMIFLCSYRAHTFTALSRKQSTVLLRTKKSAGLRCKNISRLGG